MIKVLLVAPTDPDLPTGGPSNLRFLMGGDNTYVRTLLANPPKGVEYIYHLRALKKGLISYLPIQKKLSQLVKLRILPLSGGSQCFSLHERFDLIHCHAYSLKIEKSKVPVILSDSSSNYLFLKDYINWPEWRITAQFKLRKLLFDKLGICDPDTNLEQVSKLIVFSKFARDVHIKLGASKEKIMVIPPGLPKIGVAITGKSKKEINILFVGIWFERKGGPLILEAFKILSKKFNNLRLTIVGPTPQKYRYYLKSLRNKISQEDFVPRKRLMEEFFPKADILVLVPPKAEGFGFVVLEAASFCIPAVVTKVYALPEIVVDGKTGFVITPGSLEQLIGKLELLISSPILRQKMGMEAAIRFKKQFSAKVINKKLLEVYKQVLKTA